MKCQVSVFGDHWAKVHKGEDFYVNVEEPDPIDASNVDAEPPAYELELCSSNGNEENFDGHTRMPIYIEDVNHLVAIASAIQEFAEEMLVSDRKKDGWHYCEFCSHWVHPDLDMCLCGAVPLIHGPEEG